MKNVKLLTVTFLLSASLLCSQCTPETTGLVPSTEEVLIRNTWAVDYYFHIQDLTDDFSSSRLLFSSTGAVGYQKNGETIAGTWTKTIDQSSHEFITLNFNTNDADVLKLNESWKLTSRSATSLQFEETNGTDILLRIKTQ